MGRGEVMKAGGPFFPPRPSQGDSEVRGGRRAVAGTQRDGFEAFVSARGQALQRFGFLLTSDWALAEDLVQTAFSRLPALVADRKRRAGSLCQEGHGQYLVVLVASEMARRGSGSVTPRARDQGSVSGGRPPARGAIRARRVATSATRRSGPALSGGPVRAAGRRPTWSVGRNGEEPGSKGARQASRPRRP